MDVYRASGCSSTRGLGSGWVGSFTLHKGGEEDHSEHQAEGADDDVANGKEVVAAAHHVRCRQHEALGTAEGRDIVESLAEAVDADRHRVCALWQVLIDFAEEFAEVRQTGRAHPNNEML